MKAKNILLDFFGEILKQLQGLSDADIKKLESGNFSISLKVIKKKSTVSACNILSKDKMHDLETKLHKCKDRESGMKIISSELKNRKQLETFAKHIDVFITKQDKIEKIRVKITEGIIGASLRSNAILGK